MFTMDVRGSRAVVLVLAWQVVEGHGHMQLVRRSRAEHTQVSQTAAIDKGGKLFGVLAACCARVVKFKIFLNCYWVCTCYGVEAAFSSAGACVLLAGITPWHYQLVTCSQRTWLWQQLLRQQNICCCRFCCADMQQTLCNVFLLMMVDIPDCCRAVGGGDIVPTGDKQCVLLMSSTVLIKTSAKKETSEESSTLSQQQKQAAVYASRYCRAGKSANCLACKSQASKPRCLV
ncbi:hypothetical protein COO60DRAFT_1080927 [Scenedesmus sp. NREL 46B-D3]|nr:hypothetical protein COO60DRAFT_1080927 [Scenedesmus sp. NREL 46B-D3]